MNKIYDITLTMEESLPVWPGEQGVEIFPQKVYEKDGCNVSYIKVGMHAGTHVDAPIHFTKDGKDTSEVDLTRFFGPAKVFTFDETEVLHKSHLEGLPIEEGNIVLLNMLKNNGLLKEKVFRTDYVYVAPDAATYLLEKKVRAVGVNYFSVASCFPTEGPTSHHIFLENGIVIYEGLNLEGIPAGQYQIVCLPLKIKGGNGSPVRAILYE